MFSCSVSDKFTLPPRKASHIVFNGLGTLLIHNLRNKVCVGATDYTIMFDETTTTQCEKTNGCTMVTKRG